MRIKTKTQVVSGKSPQITGIRFDINLLSIESELVRQRGEAAARKFLKNRLRLFFKNLGVLRIQTRLNAAWHEKQIFQCGLAILWVFAILPAKVLRHVCSCTFCFDSAFAGTRLSRPPIYRDRASGGTYMGQTGYCCRRRQSQMAGRLTNP
jgi:hypothetical protein